MACAQNPKGVDVNVIRALLYVFDTYEDQLRKFIGLLMVQEMVETYNWNELFRANSSTTAVRWHEPLLPPCTHADSFSFSPRQILREYTCDLGMEFLQHAYQDTIAELWDCSESYEVNPIKLTDADDLAANQKRLEDLADRVLERIFSAATLFPYQLAKIYRVLETEMIRLLERDRNNASFVRLNAIGEDRASMDAGERKSTGSLPRLSNIDEDLQDELNALAASSNAAAREEFFMHLGGLVFLRFLCPALLTPHKFHLTPDDAQPSESLKRTLILLAKLFQLLANNVEDGAREQYMLPFNAFLTRNRSRLNKFYEQICQQAQNDQRRESAILRSNATPRISQIWSRSSSTASTVKDATVNLTGVASVLGRPEESLPVLRKWMRKDIDRIASEVGASGIFRRRGKGGSVIFSSSSTKPPAAASKHRPKRKLKTYKTKAVPSSDATDASTATDTIPEAPVSRSARSMTVPGGEAADIKPRDRRAVSHEELDQIMGNTSHRDIQLMKIYYTNLSKNGLQRLLEANAIESEHEWVPHKSTDTIDVYRRNKTGNVFACSTRGGAVQSASSASCFDKEKDRLIEMKAHVIVQVTPQQMFTYLRSLESMADGSDDYRGTGMTVRKVEPLDDSRVVVYRSHSKLSLWPTWLVKPRDSCDLHSFVEKTGRHDTFAVLMESIPRPDVPELKGTVRMSYATGGFLVEPATAEDVVNSADAKPWTGAPDAMFTRLTCVVRADFKVSSRNSAWLRTSLLTLY